MTRQCAWDSSHTFESNFSYICPACYHNIYVKHFENKYEIKYFVKHIDIMKIEYEIHELENRIARLKKEHETLGSKIKMIDFECALCNETSQIEEDERWRYICNKCYTNYAVPLLKLYSKNKIRSIIEGFSEENRDNPSTLQDILDYAEEHYGSK